MSAISNFIQSGNNVRAIFTTPVSIIASSTPRPLVEPDWQEFYTLGTASGDPWIMGVADWKKNGNLGVVVVDHDNDTVPDAAFYWESNGDGTWQNVENYDWPLGGHAPIQVQFSGEVYFLPNDRGQSSYGKVFYNSGNFVFAQLSDDDPVAQAVTEITPEIVETGVLMQTLGFPTGVPFPDPGDFTDGIWRLRAFTDEGVELISFDGDNTVPIAWEGGAQRSGDAYLDWFDGLGIVNLASGEIESVGQNYWYPRSGTQTINPWHWDGVTVGYDMNNGNDTNLIVCYRIHYTPAGVFWKTDNNIWAEHFRTQFGHSSSFLYTKTRVAHIESDNIGKIDIDASTDVVTYSRNVAQSG